MLQTLLAERFQLALHRENRELPVFALTVAKNGTRLRASTADKPPPCNPPVAPWYSVTIRCPTSPTG